MKKQYEVPVHYEEKAKLTLGQMVEASIIEEGESPYSSPAIMIPEGKSDELRLLIDYRGLNGIAVNDPFLIPDMLLMSENSLPSTYAKGSAISTWWKLIVEKRLS